MKRVLKFEIEGYATRLPLPPGAKFLHAAEQVREMASAPGATGRLMVWFEVPEDQLAGGAIVPGDAFEVKPQHYRIIQTIPTGMPFEDNDGVYLGTVLMSGGRLVWHLYEVAR